MIEYNQLYDDIFDIVQPLLTPIQLIRDFQSDMKPSVVYTTMRLIDLQPVGSRQQYTSDTDGVYETHQTYSITIRFNMIGKGSSGDAAKLHVKLQRPSILESFASAGLHFYDRTAVRDVPKLMSTGFEDRSTFDFKFYMSVSDLDDQGFIEFIRFTEKYNHPDGSVISETTTVIDLVP